MLYPDKFYHIYNRGNNREIIFPKDFNYSYFLKKYNQFCSALFETYAYCLMPNHFHIAIQVKSEQEIVRQIQTSERSSVKKLKNEKLTDELLTHFISKEVNHFFVAFAKAINKQENRVGSLFQQRFKHDEIDSTEYLINTIRYIHLNPVKHQFVKSVEDWNHSSYHQLTEHINQTDAVLETASVLSTETASVLSPFLAVTKVLELFGGRENFKFVHQDRNEILLEKFNED